MNKEQNSEKKKYFSNSTANIKDFYNEQYLACSNQFGGFTLQAGSFKIVYKAGTMSSYISKLFKVYDKDMMDSSFSFRITS